LKRLLLALAAATTLALAACGGDDDEAAPLALDQRVASAQEAPESKPDPVEKRITVEGTDEFLTRLHEQLINPTEADKEAFEDAGFVRAIVDTRFVPETPGAPHTRESVHLATLAAQFDSDDGAQTGLDLLYADSLRPCPETCATQIAEFDVAGIPDAQGVRRYATAETIAEIGEDEEPYDSYEILFADGAFTYWISLFGGMGEVSQDELEEIARTLYERVAGAPPPSS
jgi:hypothetical protein